MENSIRRRAITRKAPTPQATDRISVILGTAGTWPASTWRSGSEMVTINPRRNATATITGRFRLLVRQVPMRSPMGVIDISGAQGKEHHAHQDQHCSHEKAQEDAGRNGRNGKAEEQDDADDGKHRLGRLFPLFF